MEPGGSKYGEGMQWGWREMNREWVGGGLEMDWGRRWEGKASRSLWDGEDMEKGWSSEEMGVGMELDRCR